MTTYSRSVSVPYAPEKMQHLVADVRSYPDFIPWITSMRVEQEKEDEARWSGRAHAAVGYKGFSETFSTDVISDVASQEITVSLVKGPFRKLTNHWSFLEEGTGSLVRFNIDFEFSNIVLRLLLEANMDRAARALMNAFIGEAHRRYRIS